MKKSKDYNKNNKVNRKEINLKKEIKKVDSGINEQGIFVFTSLMTPTAFSQKLNKSIQEIIKYFFMKGVIINVNTLLTKEQMGEYCLECGYDFKWEDQINEDNFIESISEKLEKDNLHKRPPIITIMGHVDHGKTTLLDYIRKSRVADKEAGGITQKIGAYMIEHKGEQITFIDTPGHEAFTQMRMHGANVTDIVVIVVAADDGVMPQTKEAIDHAKSANIPIVVFVNKMDKQDANPEKVISQLSEHDLVAEEWGGNTVFVKGSALSGEGVNNLLESLLLIAEMQELKANNDTVATGNVIEMYVDKGLGPVANILIKNGTLYKGDFIIAGDQYGKIKRIVNDLNQEIDVAYPSWPVSISGLTGLVNAGDKFIVTNDEKFAKDLIEKRRANKKISSLKESSSHLTEQDGIKVLNLIIKVDLDGTAKAIENVLSKIEVEGTKINISRIAIGDITETDVTLAKVTNGYIFAFNVQAPANIKAFAKSNDVIIKSHNIIYHLQEEIEDLLKGTLDPVYEEKIIGEAEVRQIWRHSDVGSIAGCRVIDGKIKRNAFAKVSRNNEVILEKGKLTSLKHGKESMNVIEAGKECGLTIEKFNDFIEGDLITIFEIVKKEI